MRSVNQKRIHRIVLAAGLIFFCSGLKAPAADPEKAALELTARDAILMALENNKSLRIERLNPELKLLNEQKQQAAFDVNMSSAVSYSGTENTSGTTSDRTSGDLEISKLLSSGSQVSIGLSTDGNSSSADNSRFSNRVGISIAKPLFENAGAGFNLAEVKKARMDTAISKYELQDFAQALVAQVEKTYWDYALAERSMDIYEESFALAGRQLEETKVMVEVGKKAEIDIVAAEAEVASRKEALIKAKGELDMLRLKLLRLLNPNGAFFWDRGIAVKDSLAAPDIEAGDAESHVEKALHSRPDINQAKLSMEKNELELVKTENGLLPDLNFILRAGKTGYAGSYGGAFKTDDDAHDFTVGLEYQYSFGNRSEKAGYRQSLIQRDQAAAAIENLELLIQQDVRIALVQTGSAKEQIAATKASRALNDEKYRVGRSTPLQVAQAQRDFTSSEIAEARAIVGYIKSLVDLFATEGNLLDRYGISILDAR